MLHQKKPISLGLVAQARNNPPAWRVEGRVASPKGEPPRVKPKLLVGAQEISMKPYGRQSLGEGVSRRTRISMYPPIIRSVCGGLLPKVVPGGKRCPLRCWWGKQPDRLASRPRGHTAAEPPPQYTADPFSLSPVPRRIIMPPCTRDV